MRVLYTALVGLLALPVALGKPVLTTDPSAPAPTATIKPRTANGQPIAITGQTDGKLDFYQGIPFAEPRKYSAAICLAQLLTLQLWVLSGSHRQSPKITPAP